MKSIIDTIIETEIKDFANRFYKDFCTTKGKKRDNIPNKQNNIFIAALGKDIASYSALMRSLDSSLGNRLEKIAKLIAQENYIVKKKVEGYITQQSIQAIASLLESYKTHRKKPHKDDILLVYQEKSDTDKEPKKHSSDYFLTLKSNPAKKYLLELKIGGDLDNKKARSEKEALLEQYVLLRNSDQIDPNDIVEILFCTAYNKYGEESVWTQSRVRQFFADEEIKIGRDFWNFICNSEEGYNLVKESYLRHAPQLKEALRRIVEHYSSTENN